MNQKNIEGFTPLLFAAYNGKPEILDLLINKGANTAAETNNKFNALHLAAQNNKVSTLIYFRESLDYNEPDANKVTPLHWAACHGSEEAVAYLLTLDEVKINLQDNEGQTPLLLATSYGNTKIVRRLLIAGANRSITNLEGKTAIQIAEES